jgi:hypothetical protein
MTRRSRWLEREEKLALFCSLIATSVIAVYLQQLKENRDSEGSFGTLVEYREFSFPSMRWKVLPDADRMRSKEKAQHVERYSNCPVSVDSVRLVQTEWALPSNAPYARNAFLWDSTTSLLLLKSRCSETFGVVDIPTTPYVPSLPPRKFLSRESSSACLTTSFENS